MLTIYSPPTLPYNIKTVCNNKTKLQLLNVDL